MNLFEGLTQANIFAETESKKKQIELYVTKANIGGLVYEVSVKDKVRAGSKTLSIYDKGNKTK